MSKVIYTAERQQFRWKQLAPWGILRDLLIYRDLIVSIVKRDFRAAYQASYLGLSWQFLVPLIMLGIFYFVFGLVLGGRFVPNTTETPLQYALALFVGLGFYNFFAQCINSSPSIITSNATYVKSLSFPLEILSVSSVANSLLNLIVGMLLTALVFLLVNGYLYWSAICVLFYILSIFMMALGLSWGLSALAVFVRDVAAITPPMTLVLMFMCPIFYPASMVPKNIKWVIAINPLAVIIEDARGCFLYGVWPEIGSMAAVFGFSLLIAVAGYFFFMRAKPAFADVI